MTSRVANHRLTVETYDEMVARGILIPDDRAELLAGEIVEKMTVGSRHAACVKKLNHFFSTALAGRAVVGVQDPVRLPPDSEPEPDLAVLKPRDDVYARVHPGPEDTILIVEVSDSSLELDRGLKLPLYAKAAIGEVWIIDLTGNSIEVYTEPRDGCYTQMRSVRGSDKITPVAFPDFVLNVSDILP